MLSWKIRALVPAVVCVLLAGCGASRRAASPVPDVVLVSERDFHIAASARQIQAGVVDLSVRNRGPDDHELIVVKEHPGTALPMRRDGVTVDEERLAPVTIGPALEPAPPGAVRGSRLRLAPGHYVLFCNMAGHYLSGMRTELWVVR